MSNWDVGWDISLQLTMVLGRVQWLGTLNTEHCLVGIRMWFGLEGCHNSVLIVYVFTMAVTVTSTAAGTHWHSYRKVTKTWHV